MLHNTDSNPIRGGTSRADFLAEVEALGITSVALADTDSESIHVGSTAIAYFGDDEFGDRGLLKIVAGPCNVANSSV